MADQNANELGKQFQELRNKPGKYSGGEYDESVDSPDGEKHKIMKALSDQLGVPGTPAADILARLGKPDELTPSIQGEPGVLPVMPGPMMASNASETNEQGSPFYYFVYYWRQKHDYLYFKIDSAKETVITSDWHYTQ